MGGSVARAAIVLVLGLFLVAGAAARLRQGRTVPVVLQLLGAVGLLVVGLAHVAEAMRVLSFMGWGRPQSIGHYLDLAGAVAGVSLFPIGYLLDAFARVRP